MIKLEYKHIHGQMCGPDKTIVLHVDAQIKGPTGNTIDHCTWPKDIDYYCTMVCAEGENDVMAIRERFVNLPSVSFDYGRKCIWRGEFARFIDDNIRSCI
jgi:hypothetical protein